MGRCPLDPHCLGVTIVRFGARSYSEWLQLRFSIPNTRLTVVHGLRVNGAEGPAYVHNRLFAKGKESVRYTLYNWFRPIKGLKH
ncbi:MAG: hypothetical protein K0S39_2332 [Paenibacillus sp.]|jgi:hypothetical protein|nr:hypothetical protein [Paenibacillus sp.]